MKQTKPRAAALIGTVFYAAAIPAGTVLCPITSFSIPVRLPLLLGLCVLFSLLASLVFTLRRPWIALCALAAPLAIGIYRFWDVFYNAFSVALDAVTAQYSIPFDAIGHIQLVQNLPEGADATAYFALLALLLSFLTAWTVARRLSVWVAAAGCLPHLVVCVIILETVPAWWAILPLAAAFALLILTQQMRVRCGAAGDTLTVRLLLPVLLLAAGLAFAVAPGTYERSDWSDSFQSKLNQVVDKLSFFRLNKETGQIQLVSPFTPSTLGSRVWDSSVSRVNLDRVGPQVKTGLHVMQIYSDIDAVYHLRADSLATYANNNWTALPSEIYENAPISPGVLMSNSSGSSHSLKIKTDMKASIYYTPYKPVAFPENASVKGDAYVLNPDQEVDYAISFSPGTPSADLNSAYEDFVFRYYLEVPDETRTALSEIVAQLPRQSDQAVTAYAEQIADYVEQSASYDLGTQRVPEGKDFATWFLTECDTGYCVHFATATAVLLRCCGIPSRYVTGYLVSAKAGQWTDVTEDDAHAWVEYYVKGLGWQVVDPTPPEPDDAGSGSASQSRPKPEQSSASSPTPDKQEQLKPENGAASSVSSASGSTQTGQGTAVSKKGGVWRWVWLPLLIAAVIFGWRFAICALRNLLLKRGSCNRRAVTYYRHILWLCRQTGAAPPEELREAALKARFSQHKLAKEELGRFVSFSAEQTRVLLSHPNRLKRIYYRMFCGLG